MNLQLAKRRWRSILPQSMLVLLVVVILAAIALPVCWCWTKWLTMPGQVDTLLVIVVILNVLQGIFGSARRRSTNWFIQYGALVSFYGPIPVLAYALSVMRSVALIALDSNALMVWAILILFAGRRRGNILTLYRLSDTLQHGLRHAERIKYFFYWLLTFHITSWELDFPLFYKVMIIPVTAQISAIAIHPWFQRSPVPYIMSSYRSKNLADYMMKEAVHKKPFFDHGAVMLETCRYPFEMRGEDGDQVALKDVLSIPERAKRHVNQVCLSYTLFSMIKRRQYGLHCAEQGDMQVLEFVLTGFSADRNDRPGIRAFEVVEMQLAFVYDHFFMEHLQLDARRSLAQSFPLPLMFMLLIFGINSFSVSRQLGISGQNAHIIFRTQLGGALLFILLVQECLLCMSHLASDWYKVWYVWQSYCTEDKVFNTPAQREIGVWLAETFFRPHRKYWQNKIGQYSLVEDCDHISVKKTVLAWMSRYFLDECYQFITHHPVEAEPVSLEDSVKGAVFFSFVRSKGSLTNGVSSLKRNEIAKALSWTCCQATHTDIILIWHVATWYCECEVRKGSKVRESTDYKVATALSKYCAYLVALLPELLPEHSLTTTNVFQRVLQEAKDLLDRLDRDRLQGGVEPGQLPRENKFELIKELELWQQVEAANLSTFEKGVALGQQLMDPHLVRSSKQRWKVMADFWAETMLYSAPSDKVSAHIDHLTMGGEFITHIWTLLTDAGILARTNEAEVPLTEDASTYNEHVKMNYFSRAGNLF